MTIFSSKALRLHKLQADPYRSLLGCALVPEHAWTLFGPALKRTTDTDKSFRPINGMSPGTFTPEISRLGIENNA